MPTLHRRPTYSNHFVGIPADVPFRPERTTPGPIIHGLQTATVVGPAGESIHVDKYGRVRVLFHWDRRGNHGEDASCWIRVSQAVAGSQYGGIAIPHVGHEVIVSFLEGDPDRPLIVGNVHNGSNMPPITLPDDKNKTMLRDHGDNKIIMQGKAGKQHLSLVSPRSLNMFAVKNVAKSLSAAAMLGGVDFQDFDDDIDGKAFGEMQTIYTALTTGAADTNPQGTALPTATGADGKAAADTGASVDINAVSEGSINGLSVGNTNAWVGNDSNTWVGVNSTTIVEGDMSTSVSGVSRTTVQGETISNLNGGSTTHTMDHAISTVLGTNDSFVLLNNSSFVLGANTSAVLGLNAGLTIGGNISLCLPMSAQLFIGFNQQTTLGVSLQTATSNVQQFGLNVQHNALNMSWDDVTVVHETMACTDAELKLIQSVLYLIT